MFLIYESLHKEIEEDLHEASTLFPSPMYSSSHHWLRIIGN